MVGAVSVDYCPYYYIEQKPNNAYIKPFSVIMVMVGSIVSV